VLPGHVHEGPLETRRLQNVSKTAVEYRGFQETRENEGASVTD
jgi:hypothetical protein